MDQCDLRGQSIAGGFLATVSDEALVASAKDGSHPAFDELCRRYSARVARMVTRITRHKEDTEDAMQDCVLRAFVHLRSFDGRSSFSTWFTRIGINSALMVLRKRRADRGNCVDDVEWNSIPDVHFLNNPEAVLFQKERCSAVREALQSLPTLLRGVMKVRYQDDLQIAEIALAMGLTESATKTRLDRGRRALAEKLSKFVVQAENQGCTQRCKRNPRIPGTLRELPASGQWRR